MPIQFGHSLGKVGVFWGLATLRASKIKGAVGAGGGSRTRTGARPGGF